MDVSSDRSSIQFNQNYVEMIIYYFIHLMHLQNTWKNIILCPIHYHLKGS